MPSAVLIRRVAGVAAAVLALTGSIVGCGSSATTSTAPSPLIRCALTVNVGTQTIPAEGGSGTLGVVATRECTWTVSVEGSWLSLKSGQSGQGDGTVEFVAAGNPDPAVRRGALVLNGQRAEFTQAAAQCTITLAESSASFAPAGGSGRVDVQASSGLCTWSASADQPWIEIRSGREGRGNASVVFQVAPTTGPPRTGTITIAEQRFSVTQSEGCTYAIAPATVAAPPEGRSGTIAITTAPACPWTASSNVSWLSFTRDEGSGPGPLGFSIQSTSGPSRTGTAVIAGQVFTVTQSQGCTYQVQPVAHSVGAGGGTANISVTTGGGCRWTASSDAPWITIQGSTSGSGSGSVDFSVAATNGPARTGSLTVAGQRVAVAQGQGCTFTINPAQETIPAAGGTGRVTVTAADGCGWTAASSALWISITSGASGTGNGAVQYTVAATTGPARSGNMTIAGHSFTVNQGQGCGFTIAPVNATVPDQGGRTSFDVQSPAGCAWTASTQTPWIMIASGASGNGNGTVQLNVAANSGPSRSGTVMVADKTFTVTQGTGCSFTLSATSQSMPVAGGSGSVGVSAPADCGWTATSNAPTWLSITAGATGSGGGTVSFTVSANAGPARSGALTIAGQTFTVTQGESCTFSIAPEQQALDAAASSVAVTVTATTGCTWTAASNVPWMIVAAGSTGTGNGAVQLAVTANSGAARTGTATIAGRTFTMNQGSGCTFSVVPETVNSLAAGGVERIDVTAGADCGWTATSGPAWIAISGGASGSGNGRVDLTVAANTGPARTGALTIAGRTVTVNQESGCTFTLTPTSATPAAAGGPGSVTVTAGAGCTWTAVSQDLWIVVTAGSSGSGNGVVEYTVEARPEGASRTGSIKIAGLTFTVTQ